MGADHREQGPFADIPVQSLTTDGEMFGQPRAVHRIAGIRFHETMEERDYRAVSVDENMVPRCVVNDVTIRRIGGRGIHLRGFGDNWIMNTTAESTARRYRSRLISSSLRALSTTRSPETEAI